MTGADDDVDYDDDDDDVMPLEVIIFVIHFKAQRSLTKFDKCANF